MKILIVGLVSLSPQIVRTIEEAEKRGHEVDRCYASDLMTDADKDSIRVYLKNNDPFENYDVIYLWTLGKRRWEWQAALKYIQSKHPIVVINQSFLDSNEDFDFPLTQYRIQTKFGLNYPKTHLIYNTKSLDLIESGLKYPLILKLAYSSKGEGVSKVDNREDLYNSVCELKKTKEMILVREFIPNDGDVRVFTVGYKAIGAMKRTPKEGDFRSNISQGGSGEVFDLNERNDIAEIAEKVSRELKMEIAGVDIMIHKETGEPYILEVNSGPQFIGLEKFTSVNAAEEIIKYMEGRAQG